LKWENPKLIKRWYDKIIVLEEDSIIAKYMINNSNWMSKKSYQHFRKITETIYVEVTKALHIRNK
jgi:hypothetical protein